MDIRPETTVPGLLCMAGETGPLGKNAADLLTNVGRKSIFSAQVSSLCKLGQYRRKTIDAWAAGMYF